MNFPIKARLTLWYVTLFAVILGMWSLFVVVLVRIDLYTGIDHSLGSRAAQIAASIKSDGDDQFQNVSNASLTGVVPAQAAAQLLSSDGAVLRHTGDTFAQRPLVDTAFVHGVAAANKAELATVKSRDTRFRVLVVRLPGSDRFILVGQSTESADDSMRRLILVMLLTGPAVLIAAGAGGWFLAKRALRPVARMTSAAARIGIDQLDERVPIPAVNDELSALAATMNGMLSRLESGVRDKRRLVANASHELQTPLAVMRAELDVSLATGDLSPDAIEVLESTREEVDRMTRIVRNLLTLARFDEGTLRLLKKPIDLLEIAEESAEALHEFAHEKHVTVTVAGESAIAHADPEYVRLVVVNLVENAIKYSGADASVALTTGSKDSEVFVGVSDTGPGIPETAAPYVFDRFYRVDHSMSKELGGSGLGLSIVREIVHAHGGHIDLESTPGNGARFTVWWPAEDSATRAG